MSYWLSILYGAVQGLTEFLPVSSSGHLAIAALLTKTQGEGNVAFFLYLHLATFIAVCAVYYRDIWAVLVELVTFIPYKIKKKPPRSEEARRLLGLVIISILPLFVMLPFKSKVESAFENPVMIGLALILTAALLFFAERFGGGGKTIGKMRVRDALVIGFAQMFAVFPGLSRSGTTLAAGLFCGLERETAVKFSFIMSLPTILGAAILEMGSAAAEGAGAFLSGPGLAGFAVAGATGYAAIGFVRLITKKGKLKYFSVYCAAVGLGLLLSQIF